VRRDGGKNGLSAGITIGVMIAETCYVGVGWQCSMGKRHLP